MSVLLSTEDGWIVSHLRYLNEIYRLVKQNESNCIFEFDEKLFDINSQFLRDNQVAKSERGILKKVEKKSRKRKKSDELTQEAIDRINRTKEAFRRIRSSASPCELFESGVNYDNNEGARAAADNFYSASLHLRESTNFCGSNEAESSVVAEVDGEKYVFPEGCSFYCYDVQEIGQKLNGTLYDFVLLDPPWWNKSIRRKKEKFVESSYRMMYNEDFAKIPIQNLLTTDGTVAVWCTNAPSHLRSIVDEMFPKWGVAYVGRWYWVKVTRSGDPICEFTTTAVKQPYESLIFGRKSVESRTNIPDEKLIVSVPSGLHSHKPPIAQLVKPYLPENAKCLEIFARYLLPNWTSWGLEVLKFQHLSLYTTVRPE